MAANQGGHEKGGVDGSIGARGWEKTVRGCVVQEGRRAVGGLDPVNGGVAKELGRER